MAQVPATQTQKSQGGGLAARREHPLERLERDFDTLLKRLWGGWAAFGDEDFRSLRVWDFDVTEKDQEIAVRAELPGFEENDLDVRIDNNVLTIKAEKEQKGDGQEEYRSFYRSVTLPPGIDPNNVKATYRNGVLELHIPRKEGARPKRIEIQGEQAAAGQQGKQANNQAAASGKGNK
jgi:HSP20 family protein